MKTALPSARLLLALAALAAGSSRAADVAGAKDHPLLKRYEDSAIFRYQQEAYAEYKLAMGKAMNPAVPSSGGRTIEREDKIEGKLTRISYVAPAGRTTLEVLRNYEQELKEKGFETLFKGGGREELGFRFAKRYEGLFSQIFEYNDSDNRFLAARLSRPEGSVTVAVFVCAFEMGLTGGLNPAKGQPLVQLDIVEEKGMEQRMVLVKADEMASQITQNGRIALYGILFDTDKAVIRPDSEPTLAEIAKLLKDNGSLRILVVGHTDTDGSFEYNRGLSQRRADAVVESLAAKGVSRQRLFPVGVSFASPVATNATEEGKAKNRRVELVDMLNARRE